VETHDRCSTGHRQAIFWADKRICQLKWFDIVKCAFGTAIVLLENASPVSRFHEPSADHNGSATAIDWNDVLECVISEPVLRYFPAGRFDNSRSLFIRRKQTQAKAVHRGSSMKHKIESGKTKPVSRFNVPR
jgi:hypothetical protein